MPTVARSSSSSRPSRVNGARSAVACTSITRPSRAHDDVHVDLGGRILRVLEVEQRLAVDDADRHCGDADGQRLAEAEAVERAPRGDVRAARSRRSACRRRPGGRRSRGRSSARRARRSPRPRAAPGRSGAGSRSCARPACHGSPRAASARRSTPAAASTRPSSSRGPCRAASAARPPRSTPCRAPSSCPASTARRRAEARGSPARSRAGAARPAAAPLSRHAAASSSETATWSTVAIGSCRNLAPMRHER